MPTYTRVYNWQNDRDAGIPISADRMDEEFDAIVAGMNTIDGALGYVTPTVSQWTALEVGYSSITAITKMSNTDIKVFGGSSLTTADVLQGALLEIGRRVAIAAGGGVSGSITKIVTAGADVTITILFDGGAVVPASIPILYVSNISQQYPNIQAPKGSRVFGILNGDFSLPAGGFESTLTFVNTGTGVAVPIDDYSELSAGIFSPKAPGKYHVSVNLMGIASATAACAFYAHAYLGIAGGGVPSTFGSYFYQAVTAGDYIPLSFSGIIPMSPTSGSGTAINFRIAAYASQALNLRARMPAGSGGSYPFFANSLTIHQLP